MKTKPKAILYKLIAVCPGLRHAWFTSSAGIVRKPYTPKDE